MDAWLGIHPVFPEKKAAGLSLAALLYRKTGTLGLEVAVQRPPRCS